VVLSEIREQVCDTILSRLQQATFLTSVGDALHFVTADRRLRLFDDVAADQQPAVFLVEHDETYEQPNRGLPPKRIMTLSIFCYARAEIGSTVGGTVINSMVGAIEQALLPDDQQAQVCTLGGLVHWCRIEGRIFKDPGDLDSQAMLIVPLRVMIP
jgi:hypothetical protein